MTLTIDGTATTKPSAGDAELIARSLTVPAVFGELFERHVDAIHRFVASRIGTTAAEDVVSETFTIAFDRRHRFDPTATSARPWLYGIAANRLHKHRDQELAWLRRSAATLPGVAEDGIESSAARIDAARLAPELATALLALSPGERDVVLMNALDDLSGDEIATALGIRPGSARSRLSRGLAKLRTSLGDDHE